MDRIVDQLFVFEGEGVIKGFPGNYSDYRTYEDSQPNSNPVKEKKEDSRKGTPAVGQLSHTEKKEFSKLEKEIAGLEKKKSVIEASFANNKISPEAIQEASFQLQGIIRDIEEKEERWLELSMKMEL